MIKITFNFNVIYNHTFRNLESNALGNLFHILITYFVYLRFVPYILLWIWKIVVKNWKFKLYIYISYKVFLYINDQITYYYQHCIYFNAGQYQR